MNTKSTGMGGDAIPDQAPHPSEPVNAGVADELSAESQRQGPPPRITDTTTRLAVAIVYAARGWPVFPLAPKAKVPLRGSHGHLDATTDPATIRRWWTEHPGANIGIRTGRESGLLVVDVDQDDERGRRGDLTLAALEREHGELPHTVRANTGRGGEHILFRYPGGRLPSRQDALGEGLDIRGDGGYIVAPPSIHPDTDARYEWQIEYHPDEVPLPEPPAWLIELIGKRGGGGADTEAISVGSGSSVSPKRDSLPSRTGPSTWEQLLRLTLPDGPGQRNDRVRDLARGLRFNLAVPTLHEAKQYVRTWWERARPFVRTQDWLSTWADFKHAWGRVVYPLGVDLAAIAAQHADTRQYPAKAGEYPDRDARRLVAICAELQRMRGTGASGERVPFSLSVSQVASLLWGDCSATNLDEWKRRRRKAHRWLCGLEDDVLKLVKPGVPGCPGNPAHRWRYIPTLDDEPTSAPQAEGAPAWTSTTT